MEKNQKPKRVLAKGKAICKKCRRWTSKCICDQKPVDEKNPLGAGRKLFDGKPEDMVTAKLKEAFEIGATDEEACVYADISQDALSRYFKKHPEFRIYTNRLKQKPILAAKNKVVSELKTSLPNAQWYLERKKKDEFSPRSEISGPAGGPIEVSPEKKARIMALIKKNRNEK